MTLANLSTLINANAQNLSQFKGLSVAYNFLGGAPSIAGYTALINANNSSNFGAGGTVKFNDENIYINTLNALYQGNAAAKTAFDNIVNGGATLSDKLELVYNNLIPASARSDAGLAYFKSQAAFYQAKAIELGVAGVNGAALIAYASLAKIAVDNDIGGLGDTVNDLVAAVNNGSAVLPADGAVFTPLEVADGTQFDGDDAPVTDPNVGKTFTLTTGVDNVVGTVANDTINGLIGAGATLSAADTIDGGNGTDTLKITYADAGGTKDGFAGALIKNIELVDVRNTNASGANDVTIAATGLQGVSASGAGDVTVTALGNNVAFTANGTSGGAFSLTNVAAATNAAVNLVGATTNAITLAGAGLTTATIKTSGAASTTGAVSSAVTGLKTWNIDAGSNLTTTINTAGTLGTLNVSGAAASVNVGTLDTDFTTVNASGLTAGGLTATMSATATTVLTGGKGNDVITTGVALTTGKVDAGDGTDKLVVAASAHLNSATLGGKYTNFETLGVLDGVSVNLDHIAGITAVEMTDGVGTTELTNLSAVQAGAITIKEGNGAATIGVKGATTVGQIDTVKMTFNNGNTTLNEAFAAASTFTLAGVENLEVTAIDKAAIVQSAAASGALTSVKLMGAGDHSFTTGDMAAVNFSLDASASTGTNTLSAATFATNGVAIKGGTGVDTITGSDQADVIDGGAGNDIINGGAGNDTINGGDGNDTITGGAGADTLTGGAGVDTFVYTTLADSLAAAPDRITDFVAGTDKIDVTTLPVTILQGAAYTAAGTGTLGTDIATALTAGGGTFAANGAAVVTLTGTGAGTYLVLNDGTAGYLAGDDAVINITGLTGTLAVTDFV